MTLPSGDGHPPQAGQRHSRTWQHRVAQHTDGRERMGWAPLSLQSAAWSGLLPFVVSVLPGLQDGLASFTPCPSHTP